ncbi:type II toxin-antitoxin system ParD family antitoxin [Brunnivagina elsteri]|uniref:Type II toxin-antitoxin system ParD family antitoxin n=1 Tax=Brunnivagina elsteri CCALA 953 TaxID=987040 RepID=A0A2A2TDA9_9CYAN|nr:type II toxin-antitoxin system ParD family antitoxin [Calothrix elsteri]PAX51636.1 type II toxin-antitoxin system ParD family antitoxin [Calothrix elsteri CCALA 953]
MTTLNISLPDAMRAFIDEEVAKGDYSTASEYIRDLIRQAQKKAEEKKLEIMLLEGLDSGKPIEVTDEWWEQKRAQIMQRFPQKNK